MAKVKLLTQVSQKQPGPLSPAALPAASASWSHLINPFISALQQAGAKARNSRLAMTALECMLGACFQEKR